MGRGRGNETRLGENDRRDCPNGEGLISTQAMGRGPSLVGHDATPLRIGSLREKSLCLQCESRRAKERRGGQPLAVAVAAPFEDGTPGGHGVDVGIPCTDDRDGAQAGHLVWGGDVVGGWR